MRGLRHVMTASGLGLLALLGFTTAAWSAQVRVATYNMQFLSTDVVNQGDRLSKLREVVALLDAHVIGLQEIGDRAALELVFPPTEWHLVIDDDSADVQDLAVAVRQPLRVVGLPADLDADDAHFLFAGEAELLFPNRRDLLAVTVQLPDESATFVVMVHHAKSRLGGRAATDPRREGAARAMLPVFERDFDDRDFILLGDFNDNPDDRSLNILETGDPNAPGGPEEIDGPFLGKRSGGNALGRPRTTGHFLSSDTGSISSSSPPCYGLRHTVPFLLPPPLDSWYNRGTLPIDIPPRRTLLCSGTSVRGLEDRP